MKFRQTTLLTCIVSALAYTAATPVQAGAYCDMTPTGGTPAPPPGNANGANAASCGGGFAIGANSNAFGNLSTAWGAYANAYGGGIPTGTPNSWWTNSAEAAFSNAYGTANLASGPYSNAYGGVFQNVGYVLRNTASGTYSSAFGVANVASGYGSNAVGGIYNLGNAAVQNTASGAFSNAFGTGNMAGSTNGTAVGSLNNALGVSDSTAVGSRNEASGNYSTAMGYDNVALLNNASAFGSGNLASGYNANAVGWQNIASGSASSAFGVFGRAAGPGSVVVSGWHDLDGNGDIIYDLDLDGDGEFESSSEGGVATGTSAVAMGAGVRAAGDASAAFGVNALAEANYSVAIGYGAVSDREYTISVGSAAQMNQIVNLAAGTEDEDAVNLSQLYPLATALGGGASYAGGIFTAPTYVIQTGNYTSIGSAFIAVDNALSDINQRIVNAGGVQGERGLSAYEVAVSNGFAGTENDWLQSLGGAQGPTGPIGPEGPAGGGPRSVTYDSDTRDVLTMAGTDGTRIANVADGVEANDAANLGQVEAGDAQTLSAANEYTDTTATQTLTAANAYTDTRFAELAGLSDSFEAFRGDTDRRFQQQDRRIDKLAAISGAYAGMAMNTAGLAGRNRIGVGVGVEGGEQALAVGYQRAIGNRASVSIAGAFSGDEKSVSAGAGFSW